MEFQIADGAPANGLNARALAASPLAAKRGVDCRANLPWWTAQAKPPAMTFIPRAFALALGQLSDPAILRVLAKSMLVTLAVFAALGIALWQGLSATLANYATGFEGLSALIAIALTIIGSWLLFRIVALAVLQFFADDVVRAVERRHYPWAADVPDLAFAKELSASGRAFFRVIAVNAVVLPVALVLLVTGVGTALLLWAANAWLSGPRTHRDGLAAAWRCKWRGSARERRDAVRARRHRRRTPDRTGGQFHRARTGRSGCDASRPSCEEQPCIESWLSASRSR